MAIVTTLHGFNDLLITGNDGITRITGINQQLEADASGLTTNKNKKRSNAVELVSDMISRLKALATMTDNAVLIKKAHYTDSDLSHANDQAFISASAVIYSEAVANVDALANYGVNEETINALKAAIDSFTAEVHTPRESITERKHLKIQMTKEFNDLTSVLTKMDVLIELLKKSESAFYEEYQSTRKVIYHAGSLTAKGLILDDITGEPIVGASIMFYFEDDLVTVVLQKQSADKGGFFVKTLDEGTYTIAVEKVGYKKQNVTVTVSDDKLCDVTIRLERV